MTRRVATTAGPGCSATATRPQVYHGRDFVCMSEASIESDGIDVFVVYNGVRIAKRGQPNSPQAGAWVSLEPGFRVLDKDYPAKLVIERDGKIISD
jgi:hypothetical protein